METLVVTIKLLIGFYTISNPDDCTATSELDDFTPETDVLDAACVDALQKFATTYGLTLDKFQRLAILNAAGRPDCGDEEIFEEWVIEEYVIDKLECTEEQRQYLEENTDALQQIFNHLVNGDYEPEELQYAIWAIIHFGEDLTYYTGKLDEFNVELDEPFEYQDDSGIEILERFVPDEAPVNYPYFGETPYRPGHEFEPPAILPEDMQSGPDGDINLLSFREGFYGGSTYHEPSGNRLLDDKSDDELFEILDSRLQSDLLNRDLKNVATAYLNRFRNRTGGDYFNEELSEYTLTNAHMEATVQDFGKWLSGKLEGVGGDIAAINEAIINDPVDGLTIAYRAIFDAGELRSGLKILVNDTEKMAVYPMDDYAYNLDTHEWSGTFYFVVYDNFGLDNQDLIDFQGKAFAGKGFAAWWILQHRRGYAPFRTEIRNAFKLKGDLDN